MKCICGYERERSYRKDIQDIGDEDFIHIIGMFRAENGPDCYMSGDHSVSLYACPKCKTVQLVD